MSKAIAGAAMLAGAAVLFFVPGLNVLFTPVLLGLMTSLAAGGLSMEAGAIADALTSNRGQNITTRQAAGLRQIIYGMQRVGGTTIYQSTTGSSYANYNYVIVLATHPCDAIVNLYLDGRQVYFKQNGNAANMGCGSIIPGTGTPAACTVTLTAGVITGITATGGTGYSDVVAARYRIVFRGGGGSGAQAYATNSGTGFSPVWTVVIVNGGSGFTSAPSAELQGAYVFGGQAAADQQDPSQPGYGLGYGIGPDGQHYNFSGLVYAEARFGDQLQGDVIAALTLNDPTWAATTGQNATGVAIVNPMTGQCPGVNITNQGLYSSVPTVSFTGGGGSGAAGYAVLSGPRVTNVVMTNLGSGYTTGAPPVVAFSNSTFPSQTPWVGGCTYLYLNVVYNAAMFPAAPEIRVTVTGKNNIYDPRTGRTGYSSNPALIAADVITDSVFGLGDNTVNQAQLIAAANVCDELISTSQGNEANYALHIHYDASTAPGDALNMMMPAMAGRLSRIGGQWFIWPAYWQGPSFNFSQSALVGTPSWTPNRSFKDLFNCVNGTYIAPNYPYNVNGNLYDANGWYYGSTNDLWPLAWQPTNYPQYAQDVLHGYSNNAWLLQDGGIILPKEITHRGVLSVVQAQRIGKIMMLRNRWQGTGSFPMQLAAWQMQPTDLFDFTWAAMSWSSKVLEVSGIRFMIEKGGGEGSSDSGGQSESDDGPPRIYVQVEVNETDITVYEWSLTEELTVYDVPANGANSTPYVISPPTGLALESDMSTAVVGTDGVVIPRILATWADPGDVRAVGIRTQYKLHSSSVWIEAGFTTIGVQKTYITGIVAGSVYDVQIATVSTMAAFSTWDQVLNFTASTGVASSITGSVLPSPVARVATVGVTGTSVTLGSPSVVGSGASVSVSGTGLVGQIVLNTGTGTLAGGAICYITFPVAYPSTPNGVVAANGCNMPTLAWSITTTGFTLSTTTQLANSQTYTIDYSIG